MKKVPNSISYEEWITERLQDPNELELYLNAVLEVFQEDRNIDTLKFALNCVCRAQQHTNPMPPPQTKEEYDATLALLVKTLNTDSDDPSRKKLDDLIKLLKSYEDEHYPIDFPEALSAIEIRMDQAGLSKKDLAPCFGSLSKARDVLAGRRDLTLSMKRSLHEKFQIPADVLLGEPNKNFNPDVNPAELKHFPWKEILNRKWIKHRTDWKDRFEEMFIELARLEQITPTPRPALLRETGKYRTYSNPNRYAVQAWCMRVANVASDNPTPNTYQTGTITHEFMQNVAQLSNHSDGPLRAQKYLHDNGINLVIEPHLPKTYLDGAALRLNNKQPIIGLTLRHDRLDNFWFTLMHELAHVGLHLDNNMGELFVDELKFSTTNLDSLEKEADDYATESLIPSNLWESSDARYSLHPSDAYQLAHSANIHPAIVVGRIRYQNNNYLNLSDLVGQGEVRIQFETQPQ